jgi:hypothetical protein
MPEMVRLVGTVGPLMACQFSTEPIREWADLRIETGSIIF